jgi:tryptophan 2,3-dioxygenase
MKQYIDKNRVEEILRNLWKKDDGYNAEHRICYNKALQEVQCELDTLEVKEVDLEEEMNKWRQKHFKGIGYILDGSGEWLERTSQLDIAKHFYELGLKAKGE